MKFETEAGTDIAMIGIWDAEASIGNLPFKRLMEGLTKDGEEGKLLRVDTGADGGYSVCVVSTEEELSAFRLEAYTRIEHEFFLKSESGDFVVGGLEDYKNDTSQIPTEGDRFKLEAGAYRVHVYGHHDEEEEIAKYIEAEAGDDFKHYQSRKNGCGLAFGAIVVGVALGFFWSWWWLVPAILLAVGVLVYCSKLNAADPRIQRVEEMILTYEKAHPALIFHFEAVPELGQSRGFFHLDEVYRKRG